MSFESPEGQREISDDEWQQLERDTAYWSERVIANKTPSKSYMHILYNLNTMVAGLVHWSREAEKREATSYDSAMENLELIKRYFKLLEENPEFAEKELVPGEGYFPIDSVMKNLGNSRSYALIEEYERRLEGGREK